MIHNIGGWCESNREIVSFRSCVRCKAVPGREERCWLQGITILRRPRVRASFPTFLSDLSRTCDPNLCAGASISLFFPTSISPSVCCRFWHTCSSLFFTNVRNSTNIHWECMICMRLSNTILIFLIPYIVSIQV